MTDRVAERRSRIAMVSNYLPGDSKQGVGYQAHDMANQLVRRGHEVTMLSPCRPGADHLYRYEWVDPGPSLRTFRWAWRLRSMRLDRFDVVHAHGDDEWLFGRGVQHHVRTMHGSCFDEALHVTGWIGRTRMAALGVTEVLSTIVADRTVAVSEATRRRYPWVRTVIPNGVDLARFTPGDKSPEPTVLFVGSYRHRKRGKLLMEVFRDEVRPQVPDAVLLMAAPDAPNAPGVVQLGRPPTDELAEHYRRAWVFCLPSTYEGFGIPYVEAMASGTAVVASPNPGAREVLRNGALGRVVPDAGLGAAIVDLLRHEPERRRLEQVGLVAARAYGWDRVLDAYDEVYRSA